MPIYVRACVRARVTREVIEISAVISGPEEVGEPLEGRVEEKIISKFALRVCVRERLLIAGIFALYFPHFFFRKGNTRANRSTKIAAENNRVFSVRCIHFKILKKLSWRTVFRTGE